MFLVMFVIVQILWKCFELWQLKNWATRTGGKFKKLYDERENMFEQVRDNMAHLKRLSNVVLGRGSANTAEPPATAEESVSLNELARNENQ